MVMAIRPALPAVGMPRAQSWHSSNRASVLALSAIRSTAVYLANSELYRNWNNRLLNHRRILEKDFWCILSSPS